MRVFLIAGELSGDKLGAALMRGLKSRLPDVEFRGVAGPLMQAEGMASLFDMTELSIMGIVEVLPKYFALKRRIRETAQAALDWKADVVISIDSPDFCLRVAKILKAQSNIPTVHYVAPSVWAWREGRGPKMAKVIDHVLALLPFEPPLMQKSGMTCDFVGHPIVAEPKATQDEADAFRASHGLSSETPLILALPGSRRGEVSRLGGIFGAALAQAVKEIPKARVVLPIAPGVRNLVRELVEGWDISPPVILLETDSSAAGQAEKRAAFAAADIALAASGTVSLELAHARTPMVIAYDMNWLSRKMIARLLKVDTVTLVNLVSERRDVPEFLGENCRPENIAPALVDLWKSPQSQLASMEITMERLGEGGEDPGARAAESVIVALAP
ncbi:lipid-A-disaccharide synthase [Falsihalocynthiibacter sp. BN13B15]|uniref:lipid-A-disaccharide synthase n=1 Tax=Falsihalocynthiibacter sp. BN13B15 TaxID=3240871 RepID=UPI003510CAE4